MSKSTLEQALLSREQMKNEFERATESSRAALSAISGRNILKTKKETAKIRRDEELAAQKRAAQIAMADAEQGISLEQSRLSFDKAERNREEQKRRADRSLAEQERRSIRSAEAQEQADRRQEAMEMLSIGLYDPSFAADLGFSEGVVKEFAQKRNAEYQKALNQKRETQKAEAEYGESLKAIAKNKLAGITSIVKRNFREKRGEDAWYKDGIDEIISSDYNSFSDLFDDDITFSDRSFENIKKMVVNRAKERWGAEKAAEIEKNYDAYISERILMKKAAGESLTNYEKHYEEDYKRDTGGAAIYTITAYKQKMDEAAAEGDVDKYNTASRIYTELLEGYLVKTSAGAVEAFKAADKKRMSYDSFSDAEREAVDAHINEVTSAIGLIERELQGVDFTVEQQDFLDEYKKYFEKVLPALLDEKAYGDEYEKNADFYRSEKEKREKYNALPGTNFFEKFRKISEKSVKDYELEYQALSDLGMKIPLSPSDFNGKLSPAAPGQATVRRAAENKYHSEKAFYTAAYLSMIKGEAERLFPDEKLNPEDPFLQKVNMGNALLYNNGREETYRGNYNFANAVAGFAAGRYGNFTEKEALRVIAICNTFGSDAAFDYYATIYEEMQVREAHKLPDFVAGSLGIVSGVTHFFTHGEFMLENAVQKNYARIQGDLTTASHQVTMEKLDQMGFGGEALELLYMGGYAILDMVPAVAVSFVPVVGKAAASGYIFAKSMATTYTEDIAAGKRADEALTHGVLSGAAEVVMEKFLGSLPGITSKNGVFTKLKDGLGKLATTKGAKIAIKYASSMGAEGFEEFLQEVISPYLSKIAADLNGIEGAELEEIDWEEAGRSFLLGAITGGTMSLIFAPFENRAMEIAAARTLQLGEVTELIDIGAQLENKTALKIKEAMQNQQPRYQGQEGLAAFVSEKDIVNIQKSIRSRRVKGAAKTLSTMIEANMEGADPTEIKRAKAIFRKVLTAQTLTLEEASAIAKDERLLAILEGMMGEQLLGKDLSPRQVALLARLASFTDENGKVSKARLALFKDAFGEFDTKAIEQILKYDSLTGIMQDGVLYENENTAATLDDNQQEAVEMLNVFSEMSGIHFLVTDQHQTGDYLASGLMAVSLVDLDQGIFYAVGHQAYQMIQQLYPEKGAELRKMVFKNAIETTGEEMVEAEITKIKQQKAVAGLEYTQRMAFEEFCARYYSVMLTQEAYTVDRTELAAVRKRIEAFCNENRITEQERRIAQEMISEDQVEAPEAVAGTGSVRFERGAEATTESQKQAVKLAKVVANAIGIDIVFYDSTIEGTYGANANGFFNEADSSIHLDLQKNLDDRKTIAFTMSHELTHFIKKWSAEKFDTFAKFLEEQYGEHGISMDELVKAKQEALGIEDPALAYEEVVCDACERMLLDSKAVEKLAALKQKDQSLFRRIINHIRSLLKKIRAEYSKNNYAPASAEAQALQQMEGVLDKFYELFEDAALDAATNYQTAEGTVDLEGRVKEQFKGVADDGKKIYQSNFQKGTPKKAKSERILNYIKNVWSKKPIELLISNGEKSRKILAKFDPTIDPKGIVPTDASKIAGGNRHGTAKEQRITLDLADDYYQIASDAIYNYSKAETGKDLTPHDGVKMWHYFINDIYFAEYGEESYEPYTVTINVKEKNDGDFVYSFNAEKESPTRQTLHAAVNAQKGINGELFFNNNISQTSQNSQDKNNSIQKQRKISSVVAPGRNDVVAELAELYRQEGVLQAAQGMGGVDADAFLENAYAGVDRLADTDIESAEMLRKVLGSIERHLGESKVSGDIIAQLENKVKEQRAREYGWKNGGDQIRPGTDFDPERDAIDSLFTSEEVAEQNDGADFAKEFADMDPFEQAQFAADRQAEIDALFEMESEAARKADWKASEYMKAVSGAASMIAEEEAAPEAKVSTEVQEEKKTFGEKVSESWNWMQRKLVDSGDAVYDIGRREGDGHLYQYYNMARASSNAAISMIQNEQTDITGKNVGKGLNEIFNPIMKKGKAYYEQFQRYLFHMHNIDRMSRESLQAVEEARAEFDLIVECYPELTRYSERDIRRMAYDWSEPLQPAALEYTKALEHKEHMENIRNIPVIGYDVTAEISEGEVQKYLREHPEFKELAEGVYRYLDNLMQYRVDSGLVSKDLADQLKTIYPHYVPTMRVQGEIKEGISFQKDNRTAIGKTVGRAEGGEAILVPLHKQIADQTLSVVREGSKNRFGTRLLKLAQQKELAEVLQIEKASDRMLGITDFEGAIDKADPFQQEEWENLFMVYDQGVQYVLSVKPELMEAVKALSPDRDVMTEVQKIGKKTVDLYKKLITSYNPAFAVRNFVRDIQDAALYSKDLKRFILNYLPAWKEIIGNGEYWRQYQALGGTYSSIFDYNQGRIKEPGNWVSNRIEWLNMAVEQAPRLAEFMATVKKGDGGMDNLMEAMYNAADITTNFGRSGTKGKIWNRSYVPFLNPSIQGWSKACRILTETKGFKPWAMLITKAAVLGYVIPALFNGILYGDDDEYELIRQRDKDINYLFKIKDGLWLKVPKGRVLSVIGMAGDRIHQMIDGEEVGWGEFISTAADQIAPVNPLTSNVVAGFVDALDNKNWYGGDIVPQSMQDDPAEEQYDATTDVISIALGKALKISPKKINYILDSYTGVVGDIVLPALSVASQQNFISKAFLIDTDYSNRLQGDFYDTLNELAVNKNSSKATVADEVKYRWWNYKAKAISEISKEIKQIQSDASRGKKDKEEALQVQYAARNALLLQSEEEYDRYIKAVDERFENDPSAKAEEIYREVNREIYGAEIALQIEGKSTYERAQRVVKEHGIDFETFYDIHFDSSVDTDKAAEMIGEGFEKDSAITLAREFEALEPEAGAESVSYMQKYKAIAGADVDESEKLFAMSLYASDSDRRRIAIGTEHDVSIDQFIAVKENLEIANEAAGKSSASNARIRAAIASTDGLTLRQQAILWQLFTSSTSAKNNPFSVSIGWETVAQIEAYKAAREEE